MKINERKEEMLKKDKDVKTIGANLVMKLELKFFMFLRAGLLWFWIFGLFPLAKSVRGSARGGSLARVLCTNSLLVARLDL